MTFLTFYLVFDFVTLVSLIPPLPTLFSTEKDLCGTDVGCEIKIFCALGIFRFRFMSFTYPSNPLSSVVTRVCLSLLKLLRLCGLGLPVGMFYVGFVFFLIMF